MTNHMAWPIASPAINSTHRGLALCSTAPNTSTCQKYVTNQEGLSDVKMQEGMDSPLVIRKFMDSDAVQMGLMATLNKNLQKSDYKVF
jgi:hypothetical protein